jgi:hypothetical protein
MNNSNKFSNISIFERREKNILYAKNLKKYIPLKLNNIKKFSRKDINVKTKNSDINDILFSFYNYQTSEGNKSQNTKFNDISNITITSIFNKTCNNFQNGPFPFYLTETEPSTVRSKKNANNKRGSRYKRLKLDNSNMQDKENKFSFLNNYKSFSKLNDYIRVKDKEKKNKKEINKTLDLIEQKRNKIKTATHDNFYNAKEYIEKTRKLMLLKYNSLVQNEKKLRIEENNENFEQIIENKINSLNKLKQLHNNVFNEKLWEYSKFINIKKDEEEKYDLELLNQIDTLKRQILSLTNRIRKIQAEKNNIIQWVLLQIKVKERKLDLPGYYIKVLELSFPKIENQRRKGKADITKIAKLQPRKSKPIQFNKEKIKSMTTNTENNLNNVVNNLINNISGEELDKILNYRQKLIFNSAEDFYEEIKNIENINIKMFQKLDLLVYDKNRLKRKYVNLLNSKDNVNSSLIFQITKYENELEQNKQIYNERKKILSEYKGNNNRSNKINIKIGKKSDKKLEIDDNENILNQKKSKLFFTVEKLFLTCLEIKVLKENSNSNDKENILLKKANINQEERILNMIKFIEIRVMKLLNEFMMYNDPKNPYYLFIRKLRMSYSKKRNIQKAYLARLEKEKKNLKLLQEIEEKNTQVLFLKNNRKDLKDHFGRVNSLFTRKKRKKVKIYIPGIEDFLFNDAIKNKLTS